MMASIRPAGGSSNRLLPFAVSFPVTCLLFINVCAWIFACGCHALWAGADQTCNVHLVGSRHCPLCSHGWMGYAGAMTLVCVPQLALSMGPRWSSTRRVLACLAAFPVSMLLVGGVWGWLEGYWG